MRRRARSTQDSLDLLLDTMCNAFGGIVLIAILVALLIETPGESEAKNTPTGEEALQIAMKSKELADLEEELAELRARHKENRELLELFQERNRLSKLLEAQQQTKSLSMVELNDQLAEILNRIARKKEELAKQNSDIALVQLKIEKIEAEQRAMDKQMDQLIASRTSETRPPELRDASGLQFNIIFKHGEIYQLARIERINNGEILELADDPAIRWEGDLVFPIVGQGLKVDRDRGTIRDFLIKIRRHNEVNSARPSKRMYISSFVYGDSFDLIDDFREMVDEVGKIQDGWEPCHPERPLGFVVGGRKSQVN